MARVTRILSLVLILASVLTVALPVFAYLYRAPVTIAGSSTTSYDMLPVIWSQDNTWLASNGFMSSTAMDTRVQTLGGLNKPWMVADDRTLTAIPVDANLQTNLYFRTGESPASAMNIITGYGGYFTVADDAALELGDEFRIALNDVYIDTSVAGVIAEKPGALSWTTDGAGNVTATVSGISETKENYETGTDGYYQIYGNGWSGQTFTLSESVSPTSIEIKAFRVNFPGTVTVSIRDTSGGVPTGDDLVSGTFNSNLITASAEGEWCSVDVSGYELAASTPYAIIVKAPSADGTSLLRWLSDTTGTYADGNAVYSTNAGVSWSSIATRDFYFRINGFSPLLVSTAAAGHYDTLELISDGTDLNLVIDGVTVDTVALGGASVPDNANNWQIMSDAVAYMGSFTIDVGGATVAEYNPTSIVRGATYDTGTVTVTNGDATVVGDATAWTSAMEGSTFISADGYYYVVDSVTDNTHLELSANYAGATLSTRTYHLYPCLPNETTADTHVGAITWGANPAGVTVTVGGMTSSGQADVGGVSDTSTSDILPVVGGTDWRPDPGVSPALQTNPLRPIVVAVSDNTTLSEYQVWVLLGIVFVIFVTVLVGANVRGHHLITGIAASGAIILLVVWDIFPLLSLIVVVFAIWGGLVSERSPSL